MSCLAYTGFWKLIYDWQTIIAGALALIAALIGAKAAYQVGNSQMLASKNRDQLQARCLAVAVAPEIMQIKADFERATKVINETSRLAKKQNWMTEETVDLILSAQIDVPPLLSQSIQQLYLLGETGRHLLQLVSVTFQYNRLVQNLGTTIRNNIDRFDPTAHQDALSGHLRVIERNLSEAESSIEPLHDGATIV